jgi:hypothetical protein
VQGALFCSTQAFLVAVAVGGNGYFKVCFLRPKGKPMTTLLRSSELPEEDRKPPKEKPDHTLPENSDENLDGKLDQALEETFPTSDPVSVKITK